LSARRFPQVRSFTTVDRFRAHLDGLGVELPAADGVTPAPEGPLAQPLVLPLGGAGERTVGNRFTVLPMEGWDATTDGFPSELVERRWERFGASGAKLVWGGEAVAVRPDGRANPRQLCLHTDEHGDALAALRRRLVETHGDRHGTTADLVVGLQLTHSGRFSRPDDGGPRPLLAYRHPVLDRRLPAGEATVLDDDALDELAADYVAAAGRAAAAGFDFVDVKACHGYLGHELLSAVDRPGRYGGSLDGRTRFLRTVAEGIAAAAPGLGLAVRMSAFDLVPFRPGPDGTGEPEPTDLPYRHAFGGDGTGAGVDLDETVAVLDVLAGLGITLVCVTAGSPYYTPHVQRPALFPPSDGYEPPEDPLVGVARLVAAAAELKRRRPGTALVGSGYSYLQEWLGPVAEAVVAGGLADSVGVGRMVLSYPELPADLLAGRAPERRRLCRTFSDCTTAPRAGLVSGCYPLDDFYKARPERVELARVKREVRTGG